MHREEEQILYEFQQGKLDLLYRKIYPGMILYTIKFLGEDSNFLAEDCVQNAIFNAWERRHHFHSIPSLKSFLFTTIKNEIISIHRKEEAKHRYISQLEDHEVFVNTCIDQEAQSILYNAIAELPEKVRQIFEMSFIEGLKNKEIAKQLNLSDSSIKKYKSYALKLLRKKLDPSLFHLLFLYV